ncbi:hypothetical protein HW555_009359 [Spodoptera exigua]|uniref:FLYWCH-type domain-containing protein n=1 Tax=Spodoptera exigua TaxID=7107 RepID=A0A835L2J5_SPOEX|nr:hypothetical protein HW555_009359 [Spodoptera exigua]
MLGNAKFILLGNNKTLIMVDNYTFSQHKHRYYYCSQRFKGCQAKLKLDQNKTQIVSLCNEHNHDPPVYKQMDSGLYFKI